MGKYEKTEASTYTHGSSCVVLHRRAHIRPIAYSLEAGGRTSKSFSGGRGPREPKEQVGKLAAVRLGEIMMEGGNRR